MKNKIKGGLSDKLTLKDIAKKHKVSIEKIETQLKKGIKVEKDHTNDESKAREIAMDHLTELPDYYDKLKTLGIDEETDASSSGAFDMPFNSQNKSNPLKIDGVKSIKNSRAIVNKDFPKWGGPDGVYVQIKEKCKKFPYCNQGDVNALEILENNELINEVSNHFKINSKTLKQIILRETMKPFKNSLSEIIKNKINENIEIENFNNDFDFNIIPKEILKTLEDNYFHIYQNNYDWNEKQDEFVKDGVFDSSEFEKWRENNEKEEFIKNLNKLIILVRQDLILLIKQRNIEKVLNDFEDLIKPTLGNEVLIGPISEYLASALIIIGSVDTDINHINKELSKAFKESKNIIDNDGSINYSKITPSKIFNGEDISLTNFEYFVKKNPDYQGVFNDWKKIFDKDIELSLKKFNSFRSSINYLDIKNLYNFLIELRKKVKGLKTNKIDEQTNKLKQIILRETMKPFKNTLNYIIKDEVKKQILSEQNIGNEDVYNIECDGKLVDSFSDEEQANVERNKYKKSHPDKNFIIVKGTKKSFDELDEMCDDINEEKNMKNEINPSYTHFAIHKKTNKIVNGWEYDSEMDKESIAYYCKIDIENMGLEPKDFKIDTTKFLDNKGINPFNTDNWINLTDLNSTKNDNTLEEGICEGCKKSICECDKTMYESKIVKKKKIVLKESDLIKLIETIINEDVPNIKPKNKKINKSSTDETDKKIKNYLKFDGNTNPTFPKSNTSNKIKKVNNTKEEDEIVSDNRGRGTQDLNYDNEPRKEFKERLKKSLTGDSTMGNSQDALNVVKNDTGKNMLKNSEKRQKNKKEETLYKKEKVPVKS
jgi:hypothetical protein